MGQNTSKTQNVIRYDKIIHLTYHSLDSVPDKVFDALKKFAPDYEVRFYDDNQCMSYLMKHFSQRHVHCFKELRYGAHKADLFRYCVLYVDGGIYMDIKTVVMRNLDSVFDRRYNYMCTSPFTQIYNGIMAVEKGHPVLEDCIQFIVRNNTKVFDNDYVINCNYMNHILQNYYGLNVQCGKDKDWMFLREECKAGSDRYKLHCTILNDLDEVAFITRYDDFPW